MILKTKIGLVQTSECPYCNFHVTQDNMIYSLGKAVVCKFCKEKEDRIIAKDCTRDVKIELPAVIEWSMTPNEIVNDINTTRDSYGFYPVGETTYNILIEAINTDRRRAEARLSRLEDGGDNLWWSWWLKDLREKIHWLLARYYKVRLIVLGRKQRMEWGDEIEEIYGYPVWVDIKAEDKLTILASDGLEHDVRIAR